MGGHDPHTEEALRGFFRSVLAYLSNRLRGKVSAEKIHRLASEVIEGLRSSCELGSWDVASPATIERAKRKSHLNRTVRIYAHVAELKDPQIVTVDFESGEGTGKKPGVSSTKDGDEFEGEGASDEVQAESEGPDHEGDEAAAPHLVPIRDEGTCVRIRDAAGSEIWSLEVLGPDLLDRLQAARRLGLPVEFLGMPIAVPAHLDAKRPDADVGIARFDIVFHLLDVRPSSSALNVVAATREERESAEERRSTLAGDGYTPFDALTDELIVKLGIAATDEFPLLRDLVEFTVLQSLAIGRITHASGHLHLLLVGPPGQGKKLVGVAARMLNPACSELSAAKVSPAGLIGASYYASGGWTSTPGLLPRAAHGVALLQDAHGWTDASVRQVGPVLQEVIEDGVVRSAVAGGIERPAPVGLIIDANRTSHLDARATVRAEAPILRLRPLLSRVDVIAEISEDPDRAWRVAQRMYERLVVHEEGATEPAWVRPLRLLVATLRDRHPKIELAPVRASMEAVHQKLYADNRDVLALMTQAGDIPTRLAISFARLVAASARAHDRSVATEADVQLALKFVNLKLGYLKMHRASLESAVQDVRDDRQEWVRQHAGATVTASDLASQYTAATGVDVSDRTIRRDLNGLGARRVGKDTWLLPPPSESDGKHDDGP